MLQDSAPSARRLGIVGPAMQAEYGDDAVKQLRQREAEERRAARAAREQGEIDVNQIPLGEKVQTKNLHDQHRHMRRPA
jgi:hypothetical protein